MDASWKMAHFFTLGKPGQCPMRKEDIAELPVSAVAEGPFSALDAPRHSCLAFEVIVSITIKQGAKLLLDCTIKI